MSHSGAQSVEIVGGRVGQGGGVQMGPELLDRIQFRGIGGQRFQMQPSPMACQGLSGNPAAMSGQPIPQQDHRAAAMAPEAVQEAPNVPTADAAAMPCQPPACTPAVGTGPQGSDPGQALPVKGFHPARRLPARCPGGSDGGTLRETACVHKTQPGLQPPGVFFTWGQRTRTQRAMAAASRSWARRAGRWRLPPNCWSTRQVCESE